MKIVCEACQAKYSIADDKVRGKVFKIRCKKCSHVIVVRGGGDGAPSTASGEFSAVPSSGAHASPFASEASWHIVVDGEQVGPLPESDVRARLTRGEISGESFIWKEGFADWVKVSSLPEFASAVPAASGGFDQAGGGFGAPAPSPSPSFGAPSPDPFAGFGAPAAAAPSGGQGADVFSSSPAAASPMADLFSSPASAMPSEGASASSGGFGGFDSGGSFGRGGGNGASPGLGAAAAGGNLTGQRHENSVLFSLSNLEALAKPSGGPIMSAPKPSSTSTTEGSGLIDIRAMAAMTVPSTDVGGPASRAESLDLPTFAAPSIAPVAPVLLPLGQSSGPPKWMYAVLGVIGLALAVSAVVIVKLLTAPPAPVAAPAPAAEPVAAAPAAPKAAAPAKAEPPPSTPPPTADEKLPPREESKSAPAPTAKASSGKSGSKASGGKKPSGKPESGMVSLDKPGAAPAAPPPTAAKEPAKPKATDSIDELLAAAAGGKKSSAAKAEPEAAPKREAPAAEAAAKLGREDIVRGMTPVTNKARECYGQYKVPGVVDLSITVAPSGKVTNAQAKGKFGGTPSGDCVESAAKSVAKFPANAGMTFNYPVMLR